LDIPYLQTLKIKNISKEKFDKENQANWFMPKKYSELDLEKYVNNLCTTQDQLDRVKIELDLYKKFNLENLLKFLIYLVDIMKDNNIVYGVGRGSSVASYILFLIGLHRIDSLKYNLDINEFLR
jgi:DNA polymerase III alpha subunit